jgi:nitrate/TMAO reductase-like tetraheme cytochrome c subunit
MKVLRDEVFFKQELWGFMHPDPPPLQRFITNRIETTEDQEQELRLDEVFYEYQNWFKQEKGIMVKCPSRKRVRDELNAIFGKQINPNNKNGWMGLKIKETMSYEEKKAFIEETAKNRLEANVSLN